MPPELNIGHARGRGEETFLLALSDRLRRLDDPLAILHEAAAAVGGYLNASRAGYAEVDADSGMFSIERDWTDGTVKHGNGRRAMASFGAETTAMLYRGDTQRIDDARQDPRVRPQDLAAFEEMRIEAAITVPLLKDGRLVALFSVQKSSPRVWRDADVWLVEEVAERTWAAYERAKTAARLRDSEATLAFLLDLSDRTRQETRPDDILRVTAELLRVRLGACCVAWGQLDPARPVVKLHRWADEASVGERPLADLDSDMLGALRAETTHRSPAGLTVPLVRDGRLVAFLSVEDATRGHWTDAEIRLLEEVAERSWANLERAETSARLAARDADAAFLLQLGDRLREKAGAADILREVVEATGRKLGAHRIGYAEIDVAADSLTVDIEWGDGTLAPILGRYPLAAFGCAHIAALSRGETARIDDSDCHPHVDEKNRPVLDSVGIRAAVTVPLIRRGELVALFSVHHATPRAWTDGEVRLVEEIAERTWAVLDRAGAEAELRRSEERLRLAVEGAQLGTWAWDLEDMRGWWSARTYEIFGVDPDTDIGPLHLELVHPDDRDRYFAAVLKALKEGREFALDYRITRADGTHRWVATRGVADRTQGARATKVTGVILDVHDRKVAEEELRQSQALLAAFMENAPVGMYLKDENGRYVMANAGMERIFRRPAAEAIGRHADEIFDEVFRKKIADQDRIALAEGRAQVAEQFLPGIEDEENWTLVIRFPVEFGSQGQRIGGFAIDMSEQKRAEAELARSREALYQSEKLTALGSLLAGVSHELNNPLSVVVAQATMMEEDTQGSPLAVRSGKIRAAAERCAKIVQTFLAMARQKTPKRLQVDMNAVVRGALELTAYGLRSDGVELVCELAEGLPPVEGDADQLHQVIANLVINAQQALQTVSHARQLRVTTRAGTAPGTVEVELADNGPGVPVGLRRRLFEPFFTTKPQGVGTGLGLSFSLGVAEAHGGTLQLVESNEGAVFRLTLPATAAPGLIAEPLPMLTATPVRGDALVIDDEADIADVIAEILAKKGWRVEVARSGAEAMERLSAADFDLVLSDLRMPDVDGLALHAWIAQAKPHLLARLGFVTGDTMGPNAVQFLDTSGCPMLEKPFTPRSLTEFVGRLRPDIAA